MPQLTPFLLFDGDCAEAMAFYQACLGGELRLDRVGDTPMKANFPEALHRRVIHAHLKSGAMEFTATDWLHPTRAFQRGNTVCLYVTDASHDELKPVFERLAVGADPALLDALRETPFGGYGHLADKFGVHWFFRSGKA